MFDLVTVGHFAIDLITSPRIHLPKPTLGGPPTYVSVAAAKLGAKVSVISKVGKDFPKAYLGWLKSNGVDLTGLEKVRKATTTRFHIRYSNDSRKLRLLNCAPRILLRDLSNSLQSKAFHIAPIANEIPATTIHKLRSRASILSLDPQGFVRDFDEKGNVHLKAWKADRTLKQIDIYKSSSPEIRAITRTKKLPQAMRKIRDYGVKVVIVTHGVKGATLLTDNEFHEIPAYKPKVFRDPTGAGDVFIGAFLAEYLRGENPVWCACVGSAAASYIVEGIGPTVFGDKEGIYTRAEEIYGKEHKRRSV
jgi:sugar/nucleoside kinase (ribokinase family)